MTDDLVAFLRARLDEDETAARVATACGDGAPYDATSWRVADEEVTGDDGSEEGISIARARWSDPGVLDHIARHDPARVLREVEAKRRIVDRYARLDHGWHEDGQTDLEVAEDEVRRILLLLALPYATHSDYEEKWRP